MLFIYPGSSADERYKRNERINESVLYHKHCFHFSSEIRKKVLIDMKQKPLVRQRIARICMIIAIVTFIALGLGDITKYSFKISSYIQIIGFSAFGVYLLLKGLTKIDLSRSNERDILWYKRYNLTGGLASLLFGLSYCTFIPARFLPDKLGTTIEASGLILFVLPSLIFYILSLKAPQHKVDAE